MKIFLSMRAVFFHRKYSSGPLRKVLPQIQKGKRQNDNKNFISGGDSNILTSPLYFYVPGNIYYTARKNSHEMTLMRDLYRSNVSDSAYHCDNSGDVYDYFDSDGDFGDFGGDSGGD